jgi:predicted aspartyl protease
MWHKTVVVFGLMVGSFSSPAAQAAEPAKQTFEQFMHDRGYAKVPLQYERTQMRVLAKINGKRLFCLIDTGSMDVLIHSQQAGKFKFLGTETLVRSVAFRTITNTVEHVLIDRIELAGTVISNQPAYAFDLRNDRTAHTGSMIPESRRTEDVILGLSFLVPTHALIDCAAPALYLRAEAPNKDLAHSMEESFKLSGFVSAPAKNIKDQEMLTFGKVNGHGAVFLIDTGGGFTMCDVDELDHFDLPDRGKVGNLRDLSNRRADLRKTRLASLKLGDFEVTGVPVGVAKLAFVEAMNGRLKLPDGTRVLGMLGPEVLVRGQALIDCASGKLFLRTAVFK